jgi:hypothetical protein
VRHRIGRAHGLVERHRHVAVGRERIRIDTPHALDDERLVDEREREVLRALREVTGERDLVARRRRERLGRLDDERLAILPEPLPRDRRDDFDRRRIRWLADVSVVDDRLVEPDLDRL